MLKFTSLLRRSFMSSLVLLVFSVGFVVPASAVDFLRTIQDIPLPEGFAEHVETVEFDTPFGRIVETSAWGQGNAEETGYFFRESLPAFGWVFVEEPLVFERREERLHINLGDEDGRVRVGFKLVVRPASSIMEE